MGEGATHRGEGIRPRPEASGGLDIAVSRLSSGYAQKLDARRQRVATMNAGRTTVQLQTSTTPDSAIYADLPYGRTL